MKTLYIIFIIIIIFLTILTFIKILYKYNNDKLKNIINTLNETMDECNKKYKIKHKELIKMIEIVESKYKIESKIFDKVKQMEEKDFIEKEKTLNKCYKEILQIKEDNKKPRELKTFTSSIKKYEDNELLIISLRTFYNKYALEYNNLLKKFPCSTIAKIKGYDIKPILEGKEIDSNFNNDLEV